MRANSFRHDHGATDARCPTWGTGGPPVAAVLRGVGPQAPDQHERGNPRITQDHYALADFGPSTGRTSWRTTTTGRLPMSQSHARDCHNVLPKGASPVSTVRSAPVTPEELLRSPDAIHYELVDNRLAARSTSAN